MTLMTVLAHALAEKWPVLLTMVVGFVVAYLVQTQLRSSPVSKFPVMGAEIGSEEKRRAAYVNPITAKKWYIDGYNKFKDAVFRVTTDRAVPSIVVPPKFLHELRNLPDDVLSFGAAIEELVHSKYTEVDTDHPVLPTVVKGKLTPNLNKLNADILDEVEVAFRTDMPPCDDWTPVNVFDILCRIVAKVSGRVFVGPELCRDEEYLDAAINYTMEEFRLERALDKVPLLLRPLRYMFMPEYKALVARRRQTMQFLKNLFATHKDVGQKSNIMMEWIMEESKRYEGRDTPHEHVKAFLNLTFAAIHTTVTTITNVFYSMAVHPEACDDLRDELCDVLAQYDGQLTVPALQKLKKLDSFLKETMRCYPMSMSGFMRKVLKPFTLSNGQHIPAGVTIEVAAGALYKDPDVYPNPDTFDYLRFYNLRENEKTDSDGRLTAVTSQFVSVSDTYFQFGYGRHACPGRFFATNEIKMMLAQVLLRFRIKTENGSTERYKQIEFGAMSLPDTSKNLFFKKRELS